MSYGKFGGNFQIDDTLYFGWSNRIESGADNTFAPTVYDVVDLSDGSVLFADLNLVTIALYKNDLHIAATDSGSPIVLSVANGFAVAGRYAVVLKDDAGTPTLDWQMITFSIDRQKAIQTDTDRIFTTETSDATADDSDKTDTMIGRIHTVERNQVQILVPRSKRILGLLGEHQLADAYLYDDDGNPSELRIRLFDTKANRDAASIWQTRQEGTNDPAPTLDTGEISRYTLTVTHVLPRNLRTVYQQAINTDQADNDFTSSVL